ncbi:glycoside hydrolase superfamily [Mucor mucedo]|uniref:GH18 domain-containing protein n=1 Tax=Mucor saturninus TaxID=64648 RepID=A0A8H7V7T4_9FUNG|nr:glycoside hydrolase superfamily [Mucor mucedo]KAG2206558.1 hypothetical protein INT47_008575 [Mucor saturninus]KAI7891483.1 glycoside hydrolase superfamily [Mucor mucedo]
MSTIFKLLFLLLTSTVVLAADKVVIGYFPNWLYGRYEVSSIDFSKYTHIHYAFAIMTNDTVPLWADPANTETQLPALVSAAHKAGCKVLISVGGWSGSITFSTMASSASTRKKFIQWNLDQIKQYNTDGVDIDWEYPGKQGAGCNVVDADSDVDNYLTLLTELRAALDNDMELSIAGYVSGFSGGSDGAMKSIGQAVTRVNLMTYDINGAWNPQTGPNSPLESPNGGVSFTSAIDSWTSAGVPANKLTGGLAFYGRSTTAEEDMSKGSMYQDQVTGDPPKGDSFDASYQDPYCSKDPGGLTGIWRFGNLISEGVLSTPTTAKAPWIRNWDNDSSTPWLFNPTTKVFISYDDPLSIAAKVKQAKTSGLAGVMVWSVDEDSSDGDLLNAAYQVRV